MLEKDRCIGCGLYVTSCEVGALKLRGKARLPNLAKMILRSKRDGFLSRNYK
ncbi:MAG: hypothetical protein HN580_16790 [Deltaproteobacteria bacterium]|nr:hypothetical protein [Deltaproteobacteria bacterium]MBT4091672.1 hypothetical protein [Deltaproteobacteria bacterium]MBT4266565.1 hypothetical protein [Deltaproteobacteria bacterium]MBT4639042.1 hypothetical protein [Deltaproteobacteria bacterium]MBT6500274.1 hypothetical protein [Deltaproteobacteria bacterium]